jgi:hypothetical protein
VGKTVIKFGLSESEIDRAIKELADYKREIQRKTEILRDRLAAEIATNAQSGFTGAIVDDLLKGGKKYAEVTVGYSHEGDLTVVIANGTDAVWVEFGAGVYHNGSSGTSPHPKGAELGMTIGGYGKGMGKKSTWGFRDEDGELHLTHGTPATMPMYNSMKLVTDHIAEIAKEVFT